MIENKQLYSYIVHSLDILNRSLQINEQDTLKLFSYLYNSQSNVINRINNINNNYVNSIQYNSNIKKIDETTNNLSNSITKIENRLKDIENKLIELDSIKDPIIVQVPVIVEDRSNIFVQFLIFVEKRLNYLYNKIGQLYNRCYQYLFREKIKKELEEQERIYNEKVAEKKRQEDIERKKRIKAILNKQKKK